MADTSKQKSRILKISAISFLSLLVLVVLAVLFLSWTILTPTRLTKTARSVMDRYVNCPTSLDNAKLSLVRSFPFLGFRLEGLTALDTMDDSPFDTLAHVGVMDVSLNLKAFMKDRRIEVTDLLLQDVSFNMFTSESGVTNLECLKSGDQDSTAGSTQTDVSVNLESLLFRNISAGYIDRSNGIGADIMGLDVDARGTMLPGLLDARVDLSTKRPAVVSIENDSADMKLNVASIGLTGELSMKDSCGNAMAALHFENPVFETDSLKVLASALSIDVNELIFNVLNIGIECASTKSAHISGSNASITTLQNSGGRIMSSLGDIDAFLPDLSYVTDSISVGDSRISLADIQFSMSDSVGESVLVKASGMNASLTGSAATDLTQIIENLNLTIDNPNFGLNGENPISARMNSLELSLDSRIDSTAVHAEPELRIADLHLALADNKLVPGWPVTLKSTLDADRDFNRLEMPLNIGLNGQNINASANLDVRNGMNNASGTVGVRFSPLDIGTLISMVPDAYNQIFDSISASGRIGLDATVKGVLKNGKPVMDKAKAQIRLFDIDADLYDAISVSTSEASAIINYPSTYYKSLSADGDLKFSDLAVTVTGQSDINAMMSGLTAEIQLKFPTDSLMPDAAKADIRIGHMTARMDTITASVDGLDAKADLDNANGPIDLNLSLGLDSFISSLGSVMNANIGGSSFTAAASYDNSKTDPLQKWSPNLNTRISNARLHFNGPDQDISMPVLDMDFSLGHFVIYDSRLEVGRSDISLIGEVYNIGSYLDNEGLLTGKLYLESDFVDVNQIMELTSGLGKDTDNELTDNSGENVNDDGPFMVPEGLDVTMHTDFGEIEFRDKMFNNVGGDITVKDGTLVIQELGFSSNAAEMQLTAIYDSPSLDSLFLEMDFHLLDIEIDELISLIPSVDSVVPMLKSFDGRAQFHLAAESYLKPDYTPIMSTLMGAAAIEGADLVVMDNGVFDGIKDKLIMSRNARNVIDSLEVELSVLRNKVTLYPFRVSMDKYTAVIGGRHNINKDLDCTYHIALIESPLPVRLGVSVSGPISAIADSPLKHISLERPEYSTIFVKEKHTELDDMIQGLQSNILNTLRSNVR